MPDLKEKVLIALADVSAPDGTPLTQTGKLSEIVANDGKVFFSITTSADQVKQWENARGRAEAAVRAIQGVTSVMVALTAERAGGGGGAAPPRAPQQPAAGAGHSHGPGHSHGQAPGPRAGGQSAPSPAGIPGVAAIIAVASGKGGVGKSTTAVNLALGLRDLGLKVGILDADIYGPSLPKLLAIREKPETAGGTRLKPIERYRMPIMSIGFLIEEETPMIWRGPMVMSALTQMLREVEWGELDVLVVDMPPGTGDAQLTMAQQVPLKGAVIVSTPQDLALIDARRGIAMFRRVNVPILGIVENMSTFICPHCGTRSDIFGHGGARHEAERLNVPFLGEIPLDMTIRENSDAGRPVVASAPDGPHAKNYREVAARVRDALAGASRPAPKIVIEA
ncbi:MAG TPA: Mrp/NBP35 family ATP-binding protein [Xanthobacteraceae bacterium]|jgi:ATP-binding protein involved in chromosome partitioning|nr:Mrp/NBP35 family ATP-binding protein [Xanthobacteraceae bacterium]